ncbi:MAG: hypothetical protein JO019_00265 [Candidatus Kaiserbacteria bacterium]|nr:hypothetical protein [Candidatus Kaiserbacteria bacterium]
MAADASLTFRMISDSASSTRVELSLASKLPLNALEASIAIPEGLMVQDIDAAGSPVAYWIESPHFDKTARTVSFAGVVPGGKTGGTVLTLDLARGQGDMNLSITSARAFEDSPDGKEVSLKKGAIDLSPSAKYRTWGAYILIVSLAFALYLVFRHLRVRFSLK